MPFAPIWQPKAPAIDSAYQLDVLYRVHVQMTRQIHTYIL